MPESTPGSSLPPCLKFLSRASVRMLTSIISLINDNCESRMEALVFGRHLVQTIFLTRKDRNSIPAQQNGSRKHLMRRSWSDVPIRNHHIGWCWQAALSRINAMDSGKWSSSGHLWPIDGTKNATSYRWRRTTSNAARWWLYFNDASGAVFGVK